jgi:O-antigen ligase
MSFRPQIWAATLDRAGESLLLGHGYLSNQFVEIPPDGTFKAHNAYLATLRDGGLIGLSLLLCALGLAVWRAYRVGQKTGNYVLLALMVFALLAIAPDPDRLLERPKELWLYFWLPLALVMTQPLVAGQRCPGVSDHRKQELGTKR